MSRNALGLSLAVIAVGLMAKGLWLPAKAELAQILLASAWDRHLSGEATAKPWPWADTWPVARLVVPRLRESQFVLRGASGRNMAFGPTHLDNSAPRRTPS